MKLDFQDHSEPKIQSFEHIMIDFRILMTNTTSNSKNIRKRDLKIETGSKLIICIIYY